MKNKLFIIGLFFSVIGLCIVYNAGNVRASAPTGLSTTQQTQENKTVGIQEITTLVATTTNCTNRVITTAGQPIMLTFSDMVGAVPTATFGHLQSASTTVIYDGGQFGCGKIKAYGYIASTTITVSNYR
jgi:hypothetical protein